MTRFRSVLRFLLPALGLALLAGALVALPGPGQQGHAGDVLRATTVCEAQELKARRAEHPDLAVEIPPELDKPFPSLAACRSHAAAWDLAAPGPMQPIPFSHAHHAGMYQVPCLYCHAGTDRSAAAGVPPVELCMGCHLQFPREYDELEGIRILKKHWADQTPIEWQQIHRLPEHVKFRHNRHVAFGIACQTCHGPVEKLDKLYLVPDTRMGPSLLPTAKLEMGWCINCHRENQASTDCVTCHH